MTRPVVALAVVAAVVAGGAREASAASGPSLSYVAPDGCPTSGEFRALVASRMRGGAGGAGPTVIAGIDAAGAGFRGVLMLRGPQGGVTSREVSAPGCDEVAQALALVAAMLLDDPAARAEAPAEAAAPPPAPSWRWGLGAGAVVQGGVGPDAVYGPQASAELRRPEGAGLPVVLGLGVSYLRAGASAVDEATSVEFSALLARAQACLRPPTRQGPLQMDVCLGGQGGRSTALLVRPGPDTRAHRGWAAGQAGVGVIVALGRDLAVRSHLGLVAPFTRDAYAVRGPAQVIHRAPAITLEGGISLGYTLP